MVERREYREETRSLDDFLHDWPEGPRNAAKHLIDRYGEPHDVTSRALTWYDVGPWKRVVVYRQEITHNFPLPHKDYLAQTIDYRVPLDKFNELAWFDGSLIVDRTAGELTARCGTEEMNLLALNIAHDLLRGKYTVDQARHEYSMQALSYLMHRAAPYVEGLQFEAIRNTGDPDRAIIPETETREGEWYARRRAA